MRMISGATAGTIGAVIFLAVGGLAQAATCTATIGDVNFGNVNVLPGTQIDSASATVSVTCSFGVLEIIPVRLCPNIGNGSGGRDAAARYMSGSSSLAYQLYIDAARTTTWGDRAQSFPSVQAIDFTGSATKTATIYGRLLASQNTKAPGDYVSHFTTPAHVNFRYGPNVLGLLACDAIDLGLLTQTASASFDVKTTIDKMCTVSTLPVAFGNQGVLNVQRTGSGALTVRCTNGTTYDIGLDNGQNGTGPGARRMKLSTSFITYGLYKASDYAVLWGNTGLERLSGTGTGNDQNIPVYGRTIVQVTPGIGTYTDNVVVTVTY